MLCRNDYPQAYIDQCRAAIDSDIKAFRTLTGAVAEASGKAAAKLSTAVDDLEPVFFNNMVLALENFFVHRTRGIEGKDGNPLNEVRVLANSLMNGDGRLVPEKSIKLDPSTSVLKLSAGDDIALREADFSMLAKAFFAELEDKFAN